MSRFLSPRLAALEPYVPGEQPQDRQYVKLNTNESPYPPSPLTQAMAQRELERMELYPDPECRALTEALARRYGVGTDQVLCANGSDDILSYIFQAFGGPEQSFVFPDVTYGFYRVYGDFYQVPYRTLPLRADFSVDPADYQGVGANVLLANPNAPTGLLLPLTDVAAIARSNPDHVVAVDEAYVDFGGESAVSLLPELENLLVVRTFSKSRSLAGGRLGFALADPALIRDLDRVKYSTNPYSVNRLTQAAGCGALEEDEYYMDCCRRIAETRQTTRRSLLDLGFEVTDSRANFLLARCPRFPGERFYLGLKEKGVLVRHFRQPRVQDWVRITIGTPEQMETLLQTVCALIEEEGK